MENDSKEPLSKRPRVSPSKAQLEKDKETKCHGAQLESEPSIPTFTMDRLKTVSPQEFLQIYNMYQAVHFKVGTEEEDNKCKSENIDSSSSFSWKDIGSIYQSLSTSDKESWCIENHETNNGHCEEKDTPTADIKSENFLAPEIKNMKAYCSFLVQKDKNAFQKTLQKLPLPNLGPIDEKWVYEPCLWIFFGRNNTCHVASATSDGNKKSGNGADNNALNDRSPLEGRGLHTDSVSHDGTWHYQLSGRKEWFISPSCDLLRHWKQQPKQPQQLEEWDESTKVHVVCEEGEVLVINTRLWFHRTIIPHQANPSVSYARDFRVESEAPQKEDSTTAASRDTKKADEQGKNGSMTNVDGLYARTEIEAGTIIFTEKDMPECELHRSKDNPNCEVVELDDGTSAVVSRRTIPCGEFFCVGDSSDDDEDEECEEEIVEEWSEDEDGDD